MKAALAITALAAFPRLVLAAWPKAAFEASGRENALKEILGDKQAEASSKIMLDLHPIAENGAVVPVGVSTDLKNVEKISILVEKNPNPLAAVFHVGPRMIADVSVRLKIRETSNVIALVEAGGKAYMVEKEIKVTIGGCGG